MSGGGGGQTQYPRISESDIEFSNGVAKRAMYQGSSYPVKQWATLTTGQQLLCIELGHGMPQWIAIVWREKLPTILPADSAKRKEIPIVAGVLDYFPNAIAYVAMISKAGNDKHNPGKPMHWSTNKSSDHAECIGRHLVDRGTVDPTDGMRHSGMLAWRALANLEEELVRDTGVPRGRGAYES